MINRINYLINRLKHSSKRGITRKSLETIIKIAATAPSGANQQPWTYIIIQSEEKKKKVYPSIFSSSCIVVLNKQNYGINKNGTNKHYYAHESACLSAGFLISALSYLGADYKLIPIVPNLNELLCRPKNETPLLLISVALSNEINDEPFFQTIKEYYDIIKKRRSVRKYKQVSFNKVILDKVIEYVDFLVEEIFQDLTYQFNIIEDANLKHRIREKAEENEKRLYQELITTEWKDALTPLGTNWHKPHLTDAPYLIVVLSNRGKINYKSISLIATGILIQTLHYVGLSTLTYTPSPMNFLCDLLNIPSKTPIMVLPVGYKSEDYKAPEIKRKDIEDFLTII